MTSSQKNLIASAFAEAWKPPRKCSPAEWAEANFRLPAAMSAEPGLIRLSRTPYARGILDAAVDPVVEELVIVAGTQVGKTTIQEILLGYWADVDPGPCLFVKPSEEACTEYIKERIRPLLESSPALKRHLSDRPSDNTLSSIKLDSMPIYFGWSGSPQSLASRPCRYVLPDECDKYPPFSGREADPVSLAKERTAWFGHRRRVILSSTPTTRDGTITRAFDACGDKRYFHVPCPHCGTFQRLVWPQVKWVKLPITDKVQLADQIEQNRLAWYECGNPDCKGRIDESHKPKMLERGLWVSDGQTVARDGTVNGERPASKRVGFHLNSLYSPARKFCEMAAEFIRADGDIAATMNFRNSRLAEPFEVQVSRREPSKIREKAEAAKVWGRAGAVRVVPNWAVLLIATADVQKDHCYYSVTAWGYELKSKRVYVGVAATLDEVYRQVFRPDVPFIAETGGGALAVSVLVFDSGYRKDEVTDFARRDPTRVQIAKGLSTYFGPIAEEKVEKASGVTVWNINTMQSKDTLDRLIGDPDAEKWQVYPDIGDEYCAQLASEHKVLDPQTKRMEWKTKTSGAANHFWDCEAMACAVAAGKGAGIPKPPDPEEKPKPQRRDNSWLGDRSAWGGERNNWLNR
ncbi:MAG TPA: terminase gpA endonuclease subunit [Gemmata sp.]